MIDFVYTCPHCDTDFVGETEDDTFSKVEACDECGKKFRVIATTEVTVSTEAL